MRVRFVVERRARSFSRSMLCQGVCGKALDSTEKQFVESAVGSV